MTIALFLCIDVVALLYWRGARRMGSSLRPRIAFYAGLLLLAGALSSPVEERADARLSAHMVQHLLLILVVPALVAYGRPVVVTILGLPLAARRIVGRIQRTALFRRLTKIVRHPVTAWALLAAVLWGWHQPDLYQAAVRSGPVHAFEHAAFFCAAAVFWSAVIDSGPRRRVSYGAALLVVFGTLLQSGWLAMVLSFAPSVVYPVYTSLADQQLAGVLMWVPMTIVFVVAIVVLFVRFLGVIDARMRRTEAIGVTSLVLLVFALAFAGCGYGRPAPYRATLKPPPKGSDVGRVLYARDCAWCHGDKGEGTVRGPNLKDRTNGPALTDFVLRTGRMPLTDPEQPVRRGRVAYTPSQIRAIVSYVDRFGAKGPSIPKVRPARADLSKGAELYLENCAACHSTTGIGGAMTQRQFPGPASRSSLVAPSVLSSGPLDVAEAIRTGPGAMPVFGEGTLDDADVDAIVSYVLYLKHPRNEGGASIGGIGPVAEGAVGLIVGLGLLLALSRWIGTRAMRTR